jgi:hypothetical protein
VDVQLCVDRPNHELILTVGGELDLATARQLGEVLVASDAFHYTREPSI